MHFKLLLIWVFLSSSAYYAQQITILDSKTNEPISGVSVFNASKTVFKISDHDGKVSLEYFSGGDDIIFKNLLYVRKRLPFKEIKNKKSIYLKRHIQGLNEVIVSASKFQQNQREVPQKVLQINTEEIALMNPQTSADLLGYTGNVYVQKSQLGGGSPMIRGFSANRLLIIVDGVRMNNSIFRGGNIQNIISIDPFSVDKSEVILGSGAVIYGSDAIGGVMSFFTKKPQLSLTDKLESFINLNTRYASANQEKTAHLDFNFGTKKWGFLSSASFSDFDDLRMGKFGPSDYLRYNYVDTNGGDVIKNNNNNLIQKGSGYNQMSLIQKVRYNSKPDTFFDLGIYYSATSDIPRYDRLIINSEDHLKYAQWYYGPQKWFMSSLQFNDNKSSSNFYDKLNAIVAYQNFKESRNDRKFQESTLRHRNEILNAVSLNIDLEKRISNNSELFYGVEYLFNKVASDATIHDINNNTFSPTYSRYPDGGLTHSLGVYSKIKIQPRSDLVLQTGLRYNYLVLKSNFESNNAFLNLPFENANLQNGAPTGDFGLSYSINDDILLKCNLSSAFRAPNIDDVGKVFDSEPGAVVVPNSNLKPEYAYGIDTGLSMHLSERLFIDLAAFYTYLDHALVRRDFNFNGQTEIIYDGELSQVQAIQNASNAKIYGFEFGMRWQILNALCLSSQLSIIDGTEDYLGASKPARHVAPTFGNAHLIWKNQKLTVDFYLNYNDELAFNKLSVSEVNKPHLYALDSNGNPYSPSWYTLNLKSEYTINPKLKLSFGIENITNQRYRMYSSGIASAGFNSLIGLHVML